MKLLRLLLLCIASTSTTVPIKAQVSSFFVNAADRRDMVHDATSDTLLITNGDEITRYNLTTNQFLAPITLPGSQLWGLDLSPDGTTLVAADRNTPNSAENRVHVVDMATLGSREIRFQRQSLESGTFVASFISNNEFLLTSSFAGSGWVPMRAVTLGPDTSTIVGSVRQNTMLTSSADLSTVAFAESNASNGPFGGYNIADGTLVEGDTSRFNYEIGVSRDASQYTVPSFFGAAIYDADLNEIDLITRGVFDDPVGVVYSPVADLLYLAWSGNSGPAIDVYDTNTLELVEVIDSNSRFSWNGNNAFAGGRLEISDDGQHLFAIVNGGVQVYETGVTAVPEPSSAFFLTCVALWGSRRRRSW